MRSDHSKLSTCPKLMRPAGFIKGAMHGAMMWNVLNSELGPLRTSGESIEWTVGEVSS